MTTFVIDASVAIKWFIQETGTAQALRLRRDRLLAPDLLLAECANVLWKKVRRQELSQDEAMVAARLLARSDIEFEPMRALLEPATRLALTLGHAAYDCCYLALAVVLDCEFVTADDALCRKVRSSGASVKIRALNGIGLA